MSVKRIFFIDYVRPDGTIFMTSPMYAESREDVQKRADQTLAVLVANFGALTVRIVDRGPLPTGI